jgi:diguanylate cyclase (GGDEF)-like protein
LTHQDDRAADVEVAWRILRGELATHQTEKRFVRPDGSLVWTIANLSFLRDETGLPLAWLGQFQDISELRRTSHDLQREASVDALTGCLNRRRGIEALDAAVEAARDAEGRLGVLMIDLDRFKQTNDTFGHLAGDDVLRATAGAVASCLGGGHELVRYGGEEFMALLPGTTPEAAMAIAEAVRRSIARLDVRARGQRVRVSASVGVAVMDAADSAQSLVARADTGLYRAKAEGRNRVVAV